MLQYRETPTSDPSAPTLSSVAGDFDAQEFEHVDGDSHVALPVSIPTTSRPIQVVHDASAIEPLTDAAPLRIRRDQGAARRNEGATIGSYARCIFACKRILALPFVCINIIYNLRMELLIIWAVYGIARSTTLAGNTRSAYDRDMAAADSDKADLQCTDEETAAEDFAIYGLTCVFLIVGFFVAQWIFFLFKVGCYPYGSVGYVEEYVRARRSLAHKALVISMLVLIIGMVIYGFVVAGDEGAPISSVASPLLEGLYTCVVACYELFDSQAYSLRARSEEVKMLTLPIPHAFTDIMSLYYELEVAILAAKLEPAQLKGLKMLGLDELGIALLLGDGLEMMYDERMTHWKEGRYVKALYA